MLRGKLHVTGKPQAGGSKLALTSKLALASSTKRDTVAKYPDDRWQVLTVPRGKSAGSTGAFRQAK
jgi:hypothetical protein